MNVQPFNAQSKAISISATSTASSSVALPASGAVVRLVNEGPNIAFVSIGSGTQTATLPSGTAAATCTPVLPNSDISLSIPADAVQNISAICRASSTAVLTVQVGEGL